MRYTTTAMRESGVSGPTGARSYWLTVLACAALLVVPLFGLLLLPTVSRTPPAPPRAKATIAVAESGAPEAREVAAVRLVVTGVVLGEGDAPVAGARVRVAGGAQMPDATSDEQGRYRLEGAPELAAVIVASKEGYTEARVPLPAAIGAADRRVDLRLLRAGPVTGVVLDADGKPAAKAFVSCDDRPGLGGSTSPDGRFELPPEAAGCTAVATHASLGPSESLRLQAARDNTLRLGRGGGLAGTVLDERGMPVTSYLIAVESFQPSGDADAPTPAGKARKIEDPSGAFVWEGLAAGRYVLTASADGRPPARSDPATVEAGRTTHHVRIQLARGATLSGTVTDLETRGPVAGATVGLDAQTATGANSIAAVTTDASGAFDLVGVPPGPFSIKITHAGYRTKIVPGLVTRGAPLLTQSFAITPRGDGGGGESELAGIGAVLAGTPKGVAVAGLIDGGPAAAAGLKKGDRIERIDGVSADALTVSDCVQRLRGPEGSRVTVGVARDGEPGATIVITRANIVR